MIYLYIIDYCQSNIYRIDISINNFINKYKEDINNVLKEYNIKESEVYYMISDNKINIIDNIID